MAKKGKHCQPSRLIEETAMFVAMVVRNAMEDVHCRHLSDEQMRELNPIIRNAICTALHAINRCRESPGAESFVNFHRESIPTYWERPVLLDDFLAMEATLDGDSGSS